MQQPIQLPLHLNFLQVLRGEKRTESCCTYPRIPEMLVAAGENGPQWYFYSKVQATVLRRKKENLNTAKLVQFVTGSQNQYKYGGEPASLLLSFQQAGTISFNLFSKERTIQFLRGATPRNYSMVFLRGMSIERALIRAYWTPNYCMCQREQLVSVEYPNTDEQYVPSAATKQYIADVSLSLSLTLERSLDEQRIREMNLLFVKDKNFPVPLLVAVYGIKTQCPRQRTKHYNNYRIKIQHPASEHQTNRQHLHTISDTYCTGDRSVAEPTEKKSTQKKSQQINNCFQCSTCRDVFDKTQGRRITRNRIHNLQIRNRLKVRSVEVVNEVVTDNSLMPNRNRRLFLLNYNEVEICQHCYDKFVVQVREQLTTEQNSRAISRKVLRKNNYSAKERSSEASDNSFMNLGHFKRPAYIRPPVSTRSKQVRTRTSITREEDHDSSTLSHARGRTIPANFNQQL